MKPQVKVPDFRDIEELEVCYEESDDRTGIEGLRSIVKAIFEVLTPQQRFQVFLNQGGWAEEPRAKVHFTAHPSKECEADFND